jgi:hypothetical protein
MYLDAFLGGGVVMVWDLVNGIPEFAAAAESNDESGMGVGDLMLGVDANVGVV